MALRFNAPASYGVVSRVTFLDFWTTAEIELVFPALQNTAFLVYWNAADAGVWLGKPSTQDAMTAIALILGEERVQEVIDGWPGPGDLGTIGD